MPDYTGGGGVLMTKDTKHYIPFSAKGLLSRAKMAAGK